MLKGNGITAAGMTVGIVMTAAVTNVLRSLVFGISPHDPATLGSVVALVGIGPSLPRRRDRISANCSTIVLARRRSGDRCRMTRYNMRHM